MIEPRLIQALLLLALYAKFINHSRFSFQIDLNNAHAQLYIYTHVYNEQSAQNLVNTNAIKFFKLDKSFTNFWSTKKPKYNLKDLPKYFRYEVYDNLREEDRDEENDKFEEYLNSVVSEKLWDKFSGFYDGVVKEYFCDHQKESGKFCALTFIPCGDFYDWNRLPAWNSSVENEMIYDKYTVSLDLQKQVHKELNLIQDVTRSIALINEQHDKQLSNHGNSLHYLKNVRQAEFHEQEQQKPLSSGTTPEQSLNSGFKRGSYFKLQENLCSQVYMSFYDPISKILVRKQAHKEAFYKYKHVRKRLFQKYQYTKPLSRELDRLQVKPTATPQVSFNDTAEVPKTPNLSLSQSIFRPIRSSQTMVSEAVDFLWDLESGRIANLNQMYQKIAVNPDDFIRSYAILENKDTKNIYINAKSEAGKVYLNKLSSHRLANSEQRFRFSFERSRLALSKLRSIDQWNIIHYEVYQPSNLTCQSASFRTVHGQTLTQSQLLNCPAFNERIFYQELEEREPRSKYQMLHDNLVEFINPRKRNLNSYDLIRCVLLEYFGKIYTCEGKLLSIEEYAFLKSRPLIYFGLIAMNHGKPALLSMDQASGNIPEFRDILKSRSGALSSSSGSSVCHDCAKTEIKTKSSLSHHQFKPAAKVQDQRIEKYAILFLIFIVLSMFWFKQKSKRSRT